MAKGKKRQAVWAEKSEKKKRMASDGATSKYAQKKSRSLRGSFSKTSPFHYDANNPRHETVEEARNRELREAEERRQQGLR